MTRATLDTQLRIITASLLHMGEMVDQLLTRGLVISPRARQATLPLIAELEWGADEQHVKLRREIFRTLALQQPLGGRDIRFLAAAIVIATHLKQSAHAAGNMAKCFLQLSCLKASDQRTVEVGEACIHARMPEPGGRMTEGTEASVITALQAMQLDVATLWQASLQVLATRDLAAVHQIEQEDDVVDVHYHMLRHELFGMLKAPTPCVGLLPQSDKVRWITLLLEIAHCLERVADHGVAICERAMFVEEGPTRPSKVAL